MDSNHLSPMMPFCGTWACCRARLYPMSNVSQIKRYPRPHLATLKISFDAPHASSTSCELQHNSSAQAFRFRNISTQSPIMRSSTSWFLAVAGAVLCTALPTDLTNFLLVTTSQADASANSSDLKAVSATSLFVSRGDFVVKSHPGKD